MHRRENCFWLRTNGWSRKCKSSKDSSTNLLIWPKAWKRRNKNRKMVRIIRSMRLNRKKRTLKPKIRKMKRMNRVGMKIRRPCCKKWWGSCSRFSFWRTSRLSYSSDLISIYNYPSFQRQLPCTFMKISAIINYLYYNLTFKYFYKFFINKKLA